MAPWDLARQPIWWLNIAIDCEQNENWAEIEEMKRQRHHHGGSSRIQ